MSVLNKQIIQRKNTRDNSLINVSCTHLYYRNEKNFAVDGNEIVCVYEPYDVRQLQRLNIIARALLGDEKARQDDIYHNTVVRFGWLDKSLNSLTWIPLPELVRQYKDKEISKTNKSKLMAICRLLFISIKDIA